MAEQSNIQLATGISAQNILVIIVYLVLIVLAAYFLTKYVAKRSLKKGMKSSPSQRGGKTKTGFGHLVSVADRIAVDRDKTIMVVEFQGKYYLMSTTADRIECIDQVDAPEIPLEDAEDVEEVSAENAKAYPAKDKTRAADEDTFFKRFKKCMKIVLQSYLPKSVRNKQDGASFETRLEAQVKKSSEKSGEKGSGKGKDDTTKG